MVADTPSDRPLSQKLGLKPGMRVGVVGSPPRGLLPLVREAGAKIVRRGGADLDAVFVILRTATDVPKIAAAKPAIAKDGTLWVLRARAAVKESVVQRAGLDAGLVDVKVVRFDDIYTAERFVYRLADRG